MTAAPVVMDESEVLLASIRAARSGDSHAFEQIMLATERRVASLAWHILGDAEEVKEALQETFLRVYRHLGRYDERRDFFGWLYRIAVNVCRDLDSRRRRWRFFRRSPDSQRSTIQNFGEPWRSGCASDWSASCRSPMNRPPATRVQRLGVSWSTTEPEFRGRRGNGWPTPV